LKKINFNYFIYSAIIALGIVIDQLTKWLAVKYLTKVNTLPIIENVLHLTYVENRGAAFGMLADRRWIFITVSTVTVLALAFLLYSGKLQGRLYSTAIAMIISGGIGNMIDRTALGYVVDFIDFRLINFAVFNGADSFVCIGAGLLVLALIKEIIKESKNKKKD
jgi:signal peptidase II